MLDIAGGLGGEYSHAGPKRADATHPLYVSQEPAMRQPRTIQIRTKLSGLAVSMPSGVRRGDQFAIQIEGNDGRCRAGV